MERQNTISKGFAMVLTFFLAINVACCLGILITESPQDKVLLGFIFMTMFLSSTLIYLIHRNNR